MTTEELDNDIDYLLQNPDKTLGSKYHDSAACWQLIDRLLARLGQSKITVKALADYIVRLKYINK